MSELSKTPIADERAQLMQVAQDLHAELKKITILVHAVTIKLTNAAEGLLIAAADEKEHAPKVTRLKYDGRRGIGEVLAEGYIPPLKHVLKPGQRACSVCREPGHRAGSEKCKLTKKGGRG